MRSAQLRSALVVLVWLGWLGWQALHPAAARADAVGDYEQVNAQLDQLLGQRQSAIARLNSAAGAEQSGLAALAASEQRLHDLLMWQQDLVQQQDPARDAIAAAEAAAAAADAERARLIRRVEAEDRWWAGESPSPEAYGSTSALVAQSLAEGNARTARETAEAAVEAARRAQAQLVANLGSANTQIAAWQAQSESLAGQVGNARARALSASAAVAALQARGQALAQTAQSQFAALLDAGYPVGVAPVAAGLPPVGEPIAWPATAPGYALPAGRTSSTLMAAAPLFVNRERLDATHALDDIGEWTAPVKGVITTPFGDGTPYQEAHYALDIGAKLFTPVVAAADGTVEFAGLAASDNRLASFGLVVLVRHNDHATTLYAHLDDRAYGLAVQAGDTVQRGQVIGYVGLTGYTTGPHLHFEVRIDNQPIDPQLLVRPDARS